MRLLKKRILYLFPGPTHTIDTPDLKDRFGSLSECFEGTIYSWTTKKDCAETTFGSFVFKAFVSEQLFGFRFKQAWFVLKDIFKKSSERKFDVVVCYDPIFSGVIGCLVKILLNNKLIIELNNSDTPRAARMSTKNFAIGFLKYHLYKIIIFATCSFADRLKVLSPALKNYIPNRFKHKVCVFHDYVPTHYFEVKKKSIGKYLLFVGYPFYRKGVDVLVNAFEKVADQFPEFELRLIGYLLEDEAKKSFNTWHKNIKFIKPMLYDDLLPYFLNCYCFVLASREEGVPRVLIESMSCEKPIIATNVGGVTDLIDGNGYLVEPDDVEGLADALKKMMGDEKKAKEMGLNSRKLMEEKFSSDIYCNKFADMIDGIC